MDRVRGRNNIPENLLYTSIVASTLLLIDDVFLLFTLLLMLLFDFQTF